MPIPRSWSVNCRELPATCRGKGDVHRRQGGPLPGAQQACSSLLCEESRWSWPKPHALTATPGNITLTQRTARSKDTLNPTAHRCQSRTRGNARHREEGQRGGGHWADDARVRVWLWRPCGLGSRRREHPEPSGFPPTGTGSRERMTAQTGAHGGEVTEVVSDPLSHPQGTPQQVIQSRDEASRVCT